MQGEVEILKNNRRIAITEGKGSYLGELSTLLGIPRTATVKTMSPCRFIIVSGDKVSDFFDRSPVMGLKLAKRLADRLAKMNVGYLKLGTPGRQVDRDSRKAEESRSTGAPTYQPYRTVREVQALNNSTAKPYNRCSCALDLAYIR
jgi:CRP-like cAMP-binding protein